MKRFILALLFALSPALVWGQTALPYSPNPNWYVTGSGTSTNDTPVASTDVSRFRVVSVQLLGTWTGIVTFEVSNDGATWTSVLLALSSSTTGAATATANGTYIGSINALYFRARFSTASSGTVNAKAVFFTTSASSGGAGGGGAAGVSSVSGTANQVTVSPTTGAVVVSLPSAITLPGTLTAGGTVALAANALQFTDATLIYDAAANIIAQRNGTNAQILRVYSTYTGSVDDWLEFNWQATANTAVIRTATNGGTNRVLALRYGGTASAAINIPTAITSGLTLSSAAAGVSTNGKVVITDTGVTATSGTDQGLVVNSAGSSASTSTTTRYPLAIYDTVNYSNGTPGAGTWDTIHLSVTETANPTGAKNFINALGGAAGATQVFHVANTGAIATASTFTSSATSDLGWAIVAATNQACNTTCTSACVFGINVAISDDIVGCTDATADRCLCAGAS